MNTIETGETLKDELRAAGVNISQFLIDKIVDVLRDHDATKRNFKIVTNLQMRVELANRVVPDGCAANGEPYNILAGTNLFEAMDMIITLGGTVEQKIRWAQSDFKRDHPLIPPIAALFNYDDAALDELFLAAAER